MDLFSYLCVLRVLVVRISLIGFNRITPTTIWS
jgi:hypothetical protein